jgi:uncharacterized protein (TIGR03382 family)
MLALLLLFGFAPLEQEQVRSGPPAPALDQRAAVQWRLSSRPAWRAFRARWGRDWAARWDERTGAPRFLWAPGVPASWADALVADVAGLAGVAASDLSLASERVRGERRILRYQRHWKGAPVEGDQVALVIQGGRVAGIWVQLSPVHLQQTPREGEVVLPLPLHRGAGPASTGVRAALATWSQEGAHVVYRDRAGAELVRYDTRHFATVELLHEERTVGDALVQSPARQVAVVDGSGGSATTADDGSHGLSGDLTVTLEGPELLVLDNGDPISVSGSGDMLLEPDGDLPYSAAQVQAAFHDTWDWLEARWPSHPWLGVQVPATVELETSACNAFYSSGTVNFFVGYSGYCNNTGRIADVIYHELGHGIHHYILAAGTFAGDVSEGSSDYVSATINDDPALAPEFYLGAPWLRELATDKVYPDDYIGEVHHDGQIWGSFLWNLREDWVDDYGEDAGVERADLLFLGALEQGPTLTDAYEAVVLADDDNGDLSDGTPHACELLDLLDQHGLGPGPIGVVVYDHQALEEQGSSAEDYPVEFELYALAAECGDLDPDSVQLWYSLEADAIPGVDGDAGDTGGFDPYEGWTSLELEQADGFWSGAIPRQPATTQVRYFVQASSGDGSQTVYSHGGLEGGLYGFLVGDREQLWCEGFEHGATDWVHGAGTPWQPDPDGRWSSEWVYGTPTGGNFLPDAPYEGSMVATTALDALYSPNNLQYLRSPVVLVEEPGPMLILSMRRWLTVEDGIYDHARMYVNDQLLWENPATEGGSDHTLDGGWTLIELPAADLLDEDNQLQLTWTLGSDPGLEFGGWALDRVCVEQLADLPGHYRVRDLVASDDDQQGITVRWTQPWITPLGGTALVRSLVGWPTSVDDGVIVHLDEAPVPGAPMELVDLEVVPDQIYHYALFAADGELVWSGEVVEGENADQGVAPSDPPEDTAPPEDTDPDDPPVDTASPCEQPEDCEACDTPEGCGCASRPGAGALAWLLLLPGLLFRRRSRDG